MESCTDFLTEFHLKSDLERSIRTLREVHIIYKRVISGSSTVSRKEDLMPHADLLFPAGAMK